MPMMKKNRKGKRKAALIVAGVVLVAAVLGSYVFSVSLNRRLKAEIDRRLPKISEKLGMEISIGEVNSNLISRTRIFNAALAVPGPEGTLPVAQIPEIEVAHSLSFRPRLHLDLKTITMKNPVFHLQVLAGGTTNLPPWLLGLASDPGKSFSKKIGPGGTLPGRIGRRIEIPSEVEVLWKGGTLKIQEGYFIQRARPLALALNDCRGRALADLAGRHLTMDASARLDTDKGRISLHGDLDKKKINLMLTAKDTRLSAFSSYVPEGVLIGEEAVANGSLALEFSPASTNHTIRLDGDLKHFGIEYWRLASHPIRDIDMQLNGLLDWDTENRKVQMHLMRIGLNEAFMDVQGTLDYLENPIMEFQLSCRQMPIQSVLDAIPKDFIPVVYGAQVQGTMDMTFDFAVDLAHPRDLTFEPQIELHDFYVVNYPEGADVRKLKEPFTHVARKKGEVVKEFVVGPSNPDFVPYDRLGRYAIRGVLTCEDGRFFRHPGFQLSHIRASLVMNLRQKRFARGGSTITMQAAKNLFLSGEKTLSRKFQEMLLTYALEHELSKERILEIYMNIIEWGPGIYGIGPAARHYFSKSPAALAPIEAAFLGSIIANPVRYHYMYSRGEVSDSWSVYLQTICSKMGIGEEAYEEAAPYRPEFGWVRKKRLEEEKKAKEEEEEKGSEDNGQGSE